MSKQNISGASTGFMKSILFLFIVLSFFFTISFCWAESAMVLPKGRWMASAGFNIYPYWDKQFNNKGDSEALANDYNRVLDARILELIDLENQLKAGFGLPDNYKLVFGRSIVEFKKRAVITNITVNYGITDKISFGLNIPYWSFKTKVKTSLDSSIATIAKNPLSDPSGSYAYLQQYGIPGPDTAPFIPTAVLLNLGMSGAEVEKFKLTKEDIIRHLSEGLPELKKLGIEGYGYKRFETWSGEDIGDIECGLKYQYFNNPSWRLAVQGGLRFPTGRKDDPDNLLDYGFGGKNYDIAIDFQNDFLKIKDSLINATLRYIIQLPDKETLRVSRSVNFPLTLRKENVDSDEGDMLELELSGNYKITSEFKINIMYSNFFKDRDSMKVEGVHQSSLEDESRQEGHEFLLGISYDNLTKYKEKLSSVPFQTSLGYWQRFIGKNINKAEYFSFKASLFF